MASKRKDVAHGEPNAKKSRKVMSLAQKVEVWDKLGRGESACCHCMGRHYGVNGPIIHQVKKCTEHTRG